MNAVSTNRTFKNEIINRRIEHSINCFKDFPGTLTDLSTIRPNWKKSVFFTEVSCRSSENGRITILPRQACAIESAAFTNPKYDIYVLYASKGVIENKGSLSDYLLEILSTYDNVKFLHVDINSFVQGTIVESLYEQRRVQPAAYPMIANSDILRLLLLQKYGGLYLDLDVLVLSNLDSVPFNCAGLESETVVNNAIMRVDISDVGKNFTNLCLEDLRNNFIGTQWGDTGPLVVTKILKKMCNLNNVTLKSNASCLGFKILPVDNFYPISWRETIKYFEAQESEELLNHILKTSNVVHVWNRINYLLEILSTYDNVKFLHVDINSFVQGTIVESFDILRLLLLQKYGGLYLDLDVLVLSNLDSVPFNCAGLESETVVNNAIMRVDISDVGKNFTNLCLEDLRNNFIGTQWGDTGPLVVTKILKKMCNLNNVTLKSNASCLGFKILAVDKFYPISWRETMKYFEAQESEELLNHILKTSNVVHVWNRISNDVVADPNSIYMNENGRITILPRQACAIESAAFTNPKYNIYVLYASKGVIENKGSLSDYLLEILSTYDNVKFLHVGINSFVQGTIVESLILKKMCNLNNVTLKSNASCLGFKILPVDNFYPISWRETIKYFEAQESEELLNHILKTSNVVHVWNRISNDVVADPNSIYMKDFPDTLTDLSTIRPNWKKSVFFTEVSCRSSKNGRITILPRQACAIESAAFTNPKYDIYVLYASKGVIKNEGSLSDYLLEILSTYDNVKFLHVDINSLVQGTIVESLYEQRKIQLAAYPVIANSDILRLLCCRNSVPFNCAGLQSETVVNNAVMRADVSDVGKNFTKLCLEDLRNNFNGAHWEYTGPLVLTKILEKMCNFNNVTLKPNANCLGFKILPIDKFYPISWRETMKYFEAQESEELLNYILKTSNVVHVWNRLSSDVVANPNSIYSNDFPDTLPDLSTIRPNWKKSVFFTEVSCRSSENRRITILPRQACAIESAAFINPKYDIYVLYTSKGVIKNEGSLSDYLLEILSTYDNVKFLHVDINSFVQGTIVETLYEQRKIQLAAYPVIANSDILRLLLLQKYGGLYLDLDVLVLSNLDSVPFNCAGLESETVVNNAVMRADISDVGKNFTKLCLEDLRNNFNGSHWEYTGPLVLTKILKKLCNFKKATLKPNANCLGFKILPIDKFYPISWRKTMKYFEAQESEELFNHIMKTSNVVHVWNKFSSDVVADPNSIYSKLAKKFCPLVYNVANKHL
ncbi:hypothetical protein FQR65_LT05974 [Abscondita terminalis]|nr:hypothetical protein FQR65_LT05974 [Abscondita terminalis]